jgi:hypothetical protein
MNRVAEGVATTRNFELLAGTFFMLPRKLGYSQELTTAALL